MPSPGLLLHRVGAFCIPGKGKMMETVSRNGAADLLGVSLRYVDILRSKGHLGWFYRDLGVRIHIADVKAILEARAPRNEVAA